MSQPFATMGSPFATTITTLDNDEIKALPTTPIMVIPAPGDGLAIAWIWATAILNTVNGAYTVDLGSTWQLIIGTQENSGLVQPSAALNAAGIKYFQFPPFFGIGAGDFAGYLVEDGDAFTSFENLPLYIGDVYNGVADYEDGNDQNTLTIEVAYRIR